MSRMDLTQAAGLLLAGGMVGAAVVILYAPQNGLRTRKDIMRLSGNTVEGRGRIEELIGPRRENV